jgi:hypothetical protein
MADLVYFDLGRARHEPTLQLQSLFWKHVASNEEEQALDNAILKEAASGITEPGPAAENS